MKKKAEIMVKNGCIHIPKGSNVTSYSYYQQYWISIEYMCFNMLFYDMFHVTDFFLESIKNYNKSIETIKSMKTIMMAGFLELDYV